MKKWNEYKESIGFSYSLGDAIDWKLGVELLYGTSLSRISYSLGDAIDWKR